MTPDDAPWWHRTVIYQIYPRSFADSDGDGIGDLLGIVSKLDYLVELGVGTLWVSPFFDSPQRDFGYDVRNYREVAPEYGTLDDADRLIRESHERGLHVMFDLVLNHTSDTHPWFVESATRRDGPKSDWYIWADPKAGVGRRRPNNWRNAMEIGRPWVWNDQRQQYYLATFLPFQPDLNWRNHEVRDEMFDTVRFWLDRGVDGFRLDIFGDIMKTEGLPNNKIRPAVRDGFPGISAKEHQRNTPDNVQLAIDLRTTCRSVETPERDEPVLLGEVFGPPGTLKQYQADGDGLQLVFLFDFLTYRYDASWMRDTISRYEREFPFPSQPTYVLENHDRSRTIDRVQGDVNKAKVLAAILLTVRGVPTIYFGQELGMSNTSIPWDRAKDPIAAEVFGWLPAVVADRLPERLNRDEMRTPMQWDHTANAGFCSAGVSPWLPVNANSRQRNVADEHVDPESMLNWYRSLLALRSSREALHSGRLDVMASCPPNVLGYVRSTAHERIAIVVNLGDATAKVSLGSRASVMVTSTDGNVLSESALSVEMRPHSATVLELH